MNDLLYSKRVTCPICGKQFTSMKVKISSCKLKKKDEDFCTHYEDLNPIYYDIFVCPFCAYAAAETSFGDISEGEIKLLKNAFLGRVVGRSFCNERSLKDAIDACKLAINTAELRKAKSSVLAALSLKLAWLYRFAADKKEDIFLSHALKNYIEAFNTEGFPIGNLNAILVMYLIGELSRRLGRFRDAITWFGKAVANPERAENPRIEKLTREQWLLAKEQYKKSGQAV